MQEGVISHKTKMFLMVRKHNKSYFKKTVFSFEFPAFSALRVKPLPKKINKSNAHRNDKKSKHWHEQHH